MLGFLSSFSKTTKSLITELIVCFLILPVACWFLSLIGADWVENTVGFIVGICTDVPIFGYFVDAIVLFFSNSHQPSAQLNFVASLLNISPIDMFTAAGVGMWTGIVFSLTHLLDYKGTPILISLIATFVSCLVASLIQTSDNFIYNLMIVAFSILLNYILGVLDCGFLNALLCGGCEMVIGVFACAFAAFLIIMMQGLIPSVGLCVTILLCIGIPLIAFCIVTRILSKILGF